MLVEDEVQGTRPDPDLIHDALREPLEHRTLPPDFLLVSLPALQCPLELPTDVREHLEGDHGGLGRVVASVTQNLTYGPTLISLKTEVIIYIFDRTE